MKDALIQILNDKLANAKKEQVNAADLRALEARVAYLEGYIQGIETCLKSIESLDFQKSFKIADHTGN